MNPLIVSLTNGVWHAGLANTRNLYQFAGATTAEQAASVQRMAELMEEGPFKLLPEMVNVFDNLANPAMVFTQLFKNTGGLMLNGEELVAAAADQSLFDVIGEAGEALLAALG